MKILNLTRALAPVAVILAAGCGRAPQLETRTFELHDLAPGEVSDLLQPYVYPDRESAPGMLSVGSEAVTVRELPENLDRIAAVLARYDQSEPGLRLRFRVIEADGFRGADTAIAEVQSELEKLFQFRGYRLAASGVLRGLVHREFNQQLGGAPAQYGIDGEILRVSAESVAMRVALWRNHDHMFNTSVNVPIGQTVVLGSGQPGGDAPAAILVVTPELAE